MLTPQYKLSIEEIYLPGQTSNNNYICENFIVYPQDKEKHGGFIFGIIEIKGTLKQEGEKIIQALVNTVKEKYYQQILTSPQPQRLNLETVLEYALQKANEVLLEMMQIGYITIRKENLNFIIAAAKPDFKNQETNIFFTHHGLTQASLIHKTAKGGYKSINVMEGDNFTDDRSQKLFSSTVAGKLNRYDRFCISTEAFTNIISTQQLSSISNEYSIAGTKDYLRALVLNNASPSNFLTNSAIMIGMEKESVSKEQPISQLSMNELISTTEQTEKLLMPTIALNLNEKFQSLVARLTRKEKKSTPLQMPIIKEKKLLWNKFPFAIFYYIVLAGKNIWNYFFQVASGKRKFSFLAIGRALTRMRRNIFGAPMVQKMTVVAIVLVIVAMMASIALVQRHNVNKAKAEQYATQVEQIKLKLNDAEFSLIAQKERDSLERLLEADALFQQLPQENKDEQTTNDALSVSITNLKNKLLHIEKSLPQIFAELLISGQPMPGAEIDFNTTAGKLVSYANQNIFILNPETKNIDSIIPSPANIKDISIDEGNIFIITTNNEIWRYGESKKLEKLDFTINFTPSDFTIYNNLYLLNNEENQIYKAKKSSTGFASSQQWLKVSSPLSGPKNMSIDGNIFVVDSANKIYKFYGGKMENFMDPLIEPKPQQLTKIFTNADSKYLYAFDPAGKRVIVLNKEGEVVKQYLFESLESITDFTVNEKTNSIFLLSGSKIYRSELTHL